MCDLHGPPSAWLAADEVHDLIRMTVVKVTGGSGPVSSPPSITGSIDQLGRLLGRAWDESATPHVEAAVVELLGIAEGRAGGEASRSREAALKRTLGKLEAALEERAPLTDAQVGSLARYLQGAYRLGKVEVGRELGWSVSFRLADQDAIAGLTANGVWWVGKTTLTGVARSLLGDAALEVIEGGLGRAEGGAVFARAVGHLATRSADYWEGFAATYVTRSRSFGALTAMVEMGARTYRYVNPLDERTSDVCRELAGTEFTVRESVRLRDRLLGSSDPEAWKTIAPWPKLDDVRDSSGAVLPAAELQRRGIAMPPLHFHCRSAIDVEEFEADEALPPPPPPVEQPVPTRVRKPRAPKPPGARGPARVSDGPAARKAAYLASRKALADAWWDPDAMVYSDATRAALARAGMYAPGVMSADVVVADAEARRLLENLDRLLAGERAALDKLLAKPSKAAWWQRAVDESEASLAPLQEAAGLLRDGLRLHDAHLTAAARWFEVAPAKERRAARREAVDAMLVGSSSRAAYLEALTDSFEGWAPELLILLRRQRATLLPTSERAECRPIGRRGGPEATFPTDVLDIGRLTAAYSKSTVAHEFGHALDQVLSQEGCGSAWSPELLRALDRPADLWSRAVRASYDAIRAKAGNTPVYMGDPQRQSEYAWGGAFVSRYEARIYSGDIEPRSGGAWDLVLGSKNAGPIEFLAMHQSYSAEPLGLTRTTDPFADLGRMVSKYQQHNGALGKTVDTYPRAYAAISHELYRTGPQLVASRPLGFTGGESGPAAERTAVASAVTLHTHYGMPLDEALAAAGVQADAAALEALVARRLREQSASRLGDEILRGIVPEEAWRGPSSGAASR